MDSLQNLRFNMKRLRVAQGLSQEALAEKAGLEYKHLQKIEAGHLPGLQLRTIDALAAGLGVLSCILICPPGESSLKTLANLPGGRPKKRRKETSGK